MIKISPPTKTIFSFEDFIKELYIAWKKTFNKEIAKNQAKLIFSKYAHETGGGKACWNYNIGNIKWRIDSFGRSDGYYMLPGTWELVGGKKIIHQPPDPSTYFRNYNCLSNGICDYLLILNKPRYAKGFQYLINGDLDNYALELHKSGYYTDTVENYTRGLKSWATKFPEKYFDELIKENFLNEKITDFSQEDNVIINSKEPIKIIHDNTIIEKEYEQKDEILKLSFWQNIINFILKLFKINK